MGHDAQQKDERRESHERFWVPLVLPAAIFLFAMLVIYGLSRIYLELNDWSVGDVTMATPLALGISVVVLLVCAMLATRSVPGIIIGAIALVAIGGLTGGAIWAAVHEEDPSEPPHVVDPTPGPGGEGIQVGLHDSPAFEITLSAETAPAGPVQFAITNDGSTLHNFRIAQTDLPPDDLPYLDEDLVVDESQLDIIESTENLDAGAVLEIAPELAEGPYVIFCNVAAHYESGMTAAFTVGPPPGDGGEAPPPP